MRERKKNRDKSSDRFPALLRSPPKFRPCARSQPSDLRDVAAQLPEPLATDLLLLLVGVGGVLVEEALSGEPS